MSESENVSLDSLKVWDYIKDNPLILGLPLSDNKGLDLLSAMRDVYLEMDKDIYKAKVLLTLLATVLVASAQGDGEEVIEEVLVQDAMFDLDKELKVILDEGQ
jgi:hypothetical protein